MLWLPSLPTFSSVLKKLVAQVLSLAKPARASIEMSPEQLGSNSVALGSVRYLPRVKMVLAEFQPCSCDGYRDQGDYA